MFLLNSACLYTKKGDIDSKESLIITGWGITDSNSTVYMQ